MGEIKQSENLQSMLEANRLAARKFNLDTSHIESVADTAKNIAVLGNDLTFISIREKDRTKHVHRLREKHSSGAIFQKRSGQ